MAEFCSDLRSQLASLPRVIDSAEQVRSYSSAIARQNMELRRARGDLRRLGCSNGSVTVFGGQNAGACASIISTINQMDRNLQVLMKKRNEMSFVGGDPAERGRILAELSENGCGQAVALGASTEAGLALEGGDLPEADDPYAAMPTTFDNWGAAPQEGPLRTVCVRTCDGGFFPISSAATPLDFRRDQRTCSMMCPQTETELFYQPLQSPGSGDMISTLTGRPYSALPNAYAYQSRDRSADKACGCDLAGYHRRMAGAGAGNVPDATAGAAPGTTRKNVGSVTTIRMHPVTSVTASEKVVIERPYDPVKDKVRMVGPSFLPDDQPALDLRNPAGTN
ncbi:DUF2865 domain-containing protein [Rhizobium sp. GN54]|uniref:DUF2865 domain-containing protein n=1 Tax=Rhizobium sp. GN54 TaxID=2898150 RepID=UPI001E3E3263|nr:DUF2865 domain-containing protein [Rhizobium sp. GN54]MCD2182011.1 DUF2865 domain-containing protein [Rhizobium sp. GN54]